MFLFFWVVFNVPFLSYEILDSHDEHDAACCLAFLKALVESIIILFSLLHSSNEIVGKDGRRPIHGVEYSSLQSHGPEGLF